MGLLDSPVRHGELIGTPYHCLDRVQLEEVLAWRNHPDVRYWMNTSETIDWQDHAKFAKSLAERTDKVYLRVDEGEQGIGAVNLSNVDRAEQEAELGLFKNPHIQRSGTGTALLGFLEAVATELLLQRLWLQVRRTNERAIALYDKAGYVVIDRDSEYEYRARRLDHGTG